MNPKDRAGLVALSGNTNIFDLQWVMLKEEADKVWEKLKFMIKTQLTPSPKAYELCVSLTQRKESEDFYRS